MSVSVMNKLTVLSPERDADKLLRRLMRQKCVEIRTLPVEDLPDGGTLLRCDCREAVSAAERRVEDVTAALSILEAHATHKRRSRPPIRASAEAFSVTGSHDAAAAVVDEVLEIRAERTALRTEYNRVSDLRQALSPWLEYDLPLSDTGTPTAELWLGTLPATVSVDAVAARAAASEEGGLHLAIQELPQREGASGKLHIRHVAVMLLRAEADEAARVLAELGFNRILLKDLPSGGTARENDELCVRRRCELENQIQAHTDRLRYLSQMLEDVQVLYDVEMTTLLAAREKEKLLTTEQCILLEAWVPADRASRVATVLHHLVCAYEFHRPAEDEEPPVLLRNNAFASNFEWVVGMYAYPKYGTYDPTFVMSIFYFFIFGIMFADVGYGVLLVAGGFLLPAILHIRGNLKRMLHMFGYCGISSAIMGFIFGGWFGDLPYALMTGFFGYTSEEAKAAYPIFNGLVVTLGGSEISLNPLEDPMVFLVIALGMGAVHLLAGMAVKFVLLCKQKQVVAAIFDVGAYWVLFAGLGLLVVNTTAALVVIGVGVLMIVSMGGRSHKNPIMRLLMGLKGLYDLINYASDLLSYSRILALGLAAAVVGQVINLLATMLGPTIPGFLLLVAVLLVGHVINIAINILGAFVHTSRLQYLEFFGKFYEDGGVPFAPATPSEKYSTAELEPAKPTKKSSAHKGA